MAFAASTALRRILSHQHHHHQQPHQFQNVASSWTTTTGTGGAAGGGVAAVLSAAAAATMAAASSSFLEGHTDPSPPLVRVNESPPSSSLSGRGWPPGRPHVAQCEQGSAAGVKNAASRSGAPAAAAAAAAAGLRKRMTLIGRFSMESESAANPSITSFFMSLSSGDDKKEFEPLTVKSMVKLWRDRGLTDRHPRFFHVVSPRQQGYFEPSSKAVVQYITEVIHPATAVAADSNKVGGVRREIQRRIAQLQTSPWDLKDALWHLYVAPGRATHELTTRRPAFPSSMATRDGDGGNADPRSLSYVFFRAHHALADGASMVAAMMDLFDEADEFRAATRSMVASHRRRGARGSSWLRRLWHRLLRMLWVLRGSIRGIWYQCKLLIVTALEPNPWHVVRQLSLNKPTASKTTTSATTATSRVVSFVDAAAPVDQVKRVARHVAGSRATVNDVFVSCITSALAKQLEQHRRRIWAQHLVEVPVQARGNVSVPVHLSGGVILPGESLGNRLGAFVVRLPIEAAAKVATTSTTTSSEVDAGNDESSEQRLRDVHRQLYYMKQTSTPVLSHWLAKGLSVASHVLPSTWISLLYARSNADSVAVVTNVRGPPSAIHLGGRKVESFHGFVPLPPGVPVGVVVSSYDHHMTLTLSAEPWAVPDGDQFLAWVLEEYLQLVKAAGA